MKQATILLLLLLITGCGATVKIKTTSPKEPPKDTVIGSFETRVLDKDKDRVNNLEICSKALDGYVLESGETFSFNDIVGKRTFEKGYEKSKILVGNEKEYAYGGGVCQISSTLYNAVLSAGLEVLERHTHSMDVHYIEPGKDAAISYGTLDLKFKNTLPHNIKIALSTDGEKVYASILKTIDSKNK